MTVVPASDVTFVPERLFKLNAHDGIAPSTASCVVKSFGECPECGEALHDVDVKDAAHVDCDVLWTDERDGGKEYVDDKGVTRVTTRSAIDRASAHECSACGVRLRVFVEEKAAGTISSERLPENAEESDIIFVPYNDGQNYVVVNLHQVMIHPEVDQ